ncbi:hypothetical protein EVA_19831, partial [gut metagenome]
KEFGSFCGEIDQNSESGVDNNIGTSAPISGVNCVYTNVESYAITPLTIRNAHFALCKLSFFIGNIIEKKIVI